MNTNIEKEFKVLLTKEQFQILTKQYKNLDFKIQTNTYYDTEEMTVKNKCGAMRIRTYANDEHMFTLKLPHEKALFEFETHVINDSLEAFYQTDIQELFNKHAIFGNLKKLTTLVTKRAIVETPFAQICFDISTYHNITDYEIEYEFKIEHDGEKQFQKILNAVGIKYTSNCLSKIQRAMNSL